MTFEPWMTLKGHSNNIMFSSVSIFRMVKINTENFALVFFPGFGQVQKPFKFGPDQTMLIRLISLMSKLLNGPIP